MAKRLFVRPSVGGWRTVASPSINSALRPDKDASGS